MTRTQNVFLLFSSCVLAAFLIVSASFAQAQELDITFPVPELGNCQNKAACHAYCDDLDHITECVAFAESHGLMSANEAREAREFARLGGEGPGGCTSKDSCENYCEDMTHMRECLAFAKQAGLMDEHELEEAEKVAAYLETGGAMPGGCRGERECRAYCESGDHMEECAEFAIKAGFMSEKEAEMFRKTGGKGPGGCSGRKCEAYCEDETHREQCIAFALEHDLMSEEDKQRMEEGKEKAREALEKAPPQVLSCIEAAMGADKLEQLKRGEGFAGPALGKILPECFRQVMGNEQHGGPFGRGIPQEARDCMRQVFGENFEERMRAGELDPGAHDNEIRECMKKQMGEGFLNDDGQWERPESGEPPREGDRRMFEGNMPDAHRMYEEEYRRQYQGQYEGVRGEMDARMREEIEAQMRSGNFDPSKLPPDFRPEGFFPPPESFNRPPEGFMPPEGYQMPPDYQRPPEYQMPPPDFQPPPSETFQESPQSSIPSASLLANVLFIVESLFGTW